MQTAEMTEGRPGQFNNLGFISSSSDGSLLFYTLKETLHLHLKTDRSRPWNPRLATRPNKMANPVKVPPLTMSTNLVRQGRPR